MRRWSTTVLGYTRHSAMSGPVKVAVVGLGRMGSIHALHVRELAQENRCCALAALVDSDIERARQCATRMGCDVPVLASIDELVDAGVCSATVIVTPTESHRDHATRLIAAGHRVLLEKPLTGIVETDRQFAAELDRE